ncbi:DNA replication complex GINS family protein [Candidatus Micrarchaeota archaeon]|jgi:DNA replication initiation complex subunit (GINS family)|nr:DNA replication complex GINS family protein [Candidatus Micrarchaeota archaeon]
MPEITYTYLRKLQNEEKETMILTELSEEFYEKVEIFVKQKKEEIEKEHSIIKIREFENTIKLLRTIFQIRQQKILLRTIQSSGDDKDGMTKEEIELFDDVKKLMKNHTQIFETSLENKKEEQKVLKKVKIVKNVPAYTGIDGSIYGPFAPEQEKELPESEVKFLIKAEMARLGE